MMTSEQFEVYCSRLPITDLGRAYLRSVREDVNGTPAAPSRSVQSHVGNLVIRYPRWPVWVSRFSAGIWVGSKIRDPRRLGVHSASRTGPSKACPFIGRCYGHWRPFAAARFIVFFFRSSVLVVHASSIILLVGVGRRLARIVDVH
jgi:hypothetical protein